MLFVSCSSLQINSQTNLCVGSTNQASYTGTGGSWISSSTAAATVNASGLVTGVASGASTVTYQTGSNVNTSLWWTFEAGSTNMGGGIFKYTPTTTSNPSLLSGFITQYNSGTYENLNWASGAPGWLLMQRYMSPTNGPYIEFSAAVATTLSNVTFNHYHNHNFVAVYDIKLQLSISGGAWTDILGSTRSCSSGTMGGGENVSLNNLSVPAGTHRLRWVTVSASPGADYFGLNNVNFTCSSNNTSTLFTQSYTILGRPTITTQPLTTVQNVCQNALTAARSLTATGAGLTYQWYVNTANNNTTGTLIGGATSASFTPPSDVVGTFYYYCIVSGTCTPAATSTVTGAVNINAPVTVSDAGINQTDALTCGLTSVTLAANTPTTGTGAWSIVSGTGGTITTAASPTSNFSGVSGNSYTLRWTITNGGCVSTDDVLITLNTKPVPVITQTGCGTPKTLTSSTWASYLWGPNNETTNSISVSVSGTYTVTTTNAIGCVSNPVSSIVNLTPVPVAGTLSGTQAICQAGTTAFTTDGNTGGTWTTSATGIATVNASTGIVTGVAAGTATITYTIPAAGGCAAVSSTRTVTVTATPNAGVLAGTQTVCSNGAVTFTTNGNTGGAWSSSATGVANINVASGVISPVAAGTSTMTYTVTGTGGCANATATRTVTITTAPNAGILSGTQAICSNATTNFTTDGNTGGAWTSATPSIATVNVSTGLVTTVANATGSSIITYTITGTGGCANTSATRTVTVTAIPVITVQPLTTVQNICQNGVTAARSVTATGGGLTYQWYVNTANNNTSGTLINTATLASYTPPSDVIGTFYYYCIVSGTCTPAVTSAVSGVVNIFAPATVSNAGADQTGSSTCGLTSFALAGNTPTTGTGAWSIISGTGGTITTAASPTSNFSGVAGNSYTLRWTITNGTCVSTDDVVITFNTIPADATIVIPATSAEVLVVAGGGGGGRRHAGGGGAGGYISQSNFGVSPGSFAIVIGAGGAGSTTDNISGANGSNSSFSTLTAIGGGGGRSMSGVALTGGSGGGGVNGQSGGLGTLGQGNKGGDQNNGVYVGGMPHGCGGGGAGAAGANTTGQASSPGGIGLSNSITGVSTFYCGGGGGGVNTATAMNGGNGGGGAGGVSTSMTGIGATPNTGGGGGGGGANGASTGSGGNGGSGIVIIKYLGTQVATGGTITQVNGYTIHKFTANGTFNLTGAASAVVPNQSRCGAGTVIFTSTLSAGLTLDWYDAATGGTLLSQGTASYTTPTISATTIYYVAVRNATTGCVSANRLAVTATINGGSTITANQTICVGTNPANVLVTSAGSTFQWQSSTDNTTFANIVGQTNATLTGTAIGNVFSTMYYRSVVTTGSCILNSPVHTISVTNPTLISTPVSGNIIWRGNTSSDWTTLANWNQYNGTNYIAASVLPVAASNVIIPAAASCIANQPTILTNTVNFNNLTIEAGASLTATTGTMNVNGNWTNNGTFTSGTGTVNFTGNTAQSIGGNIASDFYSLTINKSGNSLTLSNPTTVANTLTMTAGNIVTTTANLLTIGTSATSVGSLNWTAGSVVGPLQRYFSATANATAASGIFPVGNATNNRYAQVNFTANPTIGGTITAEYIPGICPIGNQGLPDVINGAYINNYEDEGYWSIAPSGGNLNSTAYSLTLHGLNLSTVTNLSSLRIIKSSNHNTWNDNVAGDGNYTSPIGTNADFTIGATSMLGFSWFNIGSNSANALPIELIDFQGTCQDEQLNLQWSTASEQNSAKFIVEKSRDLINWQTVAEKSAAGNSNYFIAYAQADTNPFEGINYYQLRQIDFDGAESKFGPISVSCNSIENNYVLYPNPTAGSFNVELFNTEQETIQCAVYDLSGKLIYQRSQAIAQGTTLLYFENLELQKGSYIFQIKGEKSTWENELFIVD